ncbi:LOW QUALITY PROTEIN: trafficking kinesin-binding protein 1-like [Oxyura jamaicensis]|uniref:LOW QUALITY PROTEIN: trafficking kinesin-binding protein 1-like n=1 Tax=Oxyura jamaicensis TaxID=8884 RepID=UPI0015A71E3E|nr:LOW QUALITY PROTEIN: trafficking kinesin-binding protein 1-like [Oxyura jamaicensis]
MGEGPAAASAPGAASAQRHRPEKGLCLLPAPLRGVREEGVSPHGSRLPHVTPAKLDTAGPQETPPGQRPPAHCLLSGPASPLAALPHADPVPPAAGRRRDAATITDLCSGGDVPEVEIISLLGEQLPRYKLRADTVFGYDHDDWLRAPPAPPEPAAPLTPKQIAETLQYFLLCTERAVRITKTYHDIDAVTNLLDEKERDLELAARIGQSLLKQNRSLTERNELLEEQLELAKEEIAQLRHEVSMRDDLLHFYTTTTEESEPTSATATPLRRQESSSSLQQFFQYDTLQQKLKCLEEENQKLRLEATNIAIETCQYEDQEHQLMIDCVEQFSEASQQVVCLSDELARKAEDTVRQQEEISQLLAQVVDLQQKCRAVSGPVPCPVPCPVLGGGGGGAGPAPPPPPLQLRDLQEKYTECGGMLQEAQEEVKSLRSRSFPNSTVSRYGAPSLLPLDSLAAEIKGTMRKGTDGSSSDYKSYLRVFETVKAVNQAAKAKSCSESPLNVPSSKQMSAAPSGGGNTPPAGLCGSEGTRGEGSGEEPRGAAPGRRDLEAAVQRLSARQQSHASEERSFFEAERERKLWRLRDGEGSSGFLTPSESVLSTGTNHSGGSELTTGSGFSLGSLTYLPDKLQIVKPLEGSVTLHHWQQLARPNLGGILVPRPGVLTKDFRQLDIDLEEVYSLTDLEEDEVEAASFQLLPTSTPAKAKERPGVFLSANNLPQTPSTFTITTCHIFHPTTEITTVTPSLYNAVVPSCGPIERLNLCTPPPALPSPGPPSTPLGLVRLLLVRGISASVPSAASWWPPSLPAQDPRCSLQPFPGAGGQQRPSPPSSIFSLNLVEKLRRLGLDKVVARGELSYARGEHRGGRDPPT